MRSQVELLRRADRVMLQSEQGDSLHIADHQTGTDKHARSHKQRKAHACLKTEQLVADLIISIMVMGMIKMRRAHTINKIMQRAP